MVIRTLIPGPPVRWDGTIVGLLLILLVISITGYPTGAPLEACGDMMPAHALPPQDSTNLLGITMTTSVMIGDDEDDDDDDDKTTVHVSLIGNQPPWGFFEGFMIQARHVGGNTPVGSFTRIPEGQQGLECNGVKNSAVTHTNNDKKLGVSFSWRPSKKKDDVTNLVFVATIVKNYNLYWTNITSDVLFPAVSPTPSDRNDPDENSTTTDPIPTMEKQTTPVVVITTQLATENSTMNSMTLFQNSTTVAPSTDGSNMTTYLNPTTSVAPITNDSTTDSSLNTTTNDYMTEYLNSTTDSVTKYVTDSKNGTTNGTTVSSNVSESVTTTLASTSDIVNTTSDATTDDVVSTTQSTLNTTSYTTNVTINSPGLNLTTGEPDFNTTLYPGNVSTTSNPENVTTSLNPENVTTSSSFSTVNVTLPADNMTTTQEPAATTVIMAPTTLQTTQMTTEFNNATTADISTTMDETDNNGTFTTMGMLSTNETSVGNMTTSSSPMNTTSVSSTMAKTTVPTVTNDSFVTTSGNQSSTTVPNVTAIVTSTETTMQVTNVSLTTLSAVTNDSSVTTDDATSISNVTAMVTESSTTLNVTTMETTTETTMHVTNVSLTTMSAVTNDSSVTTDDMTTISNVTVMMTEPSTTSNVSTMVTTTETTMQVTNVSLTTMSAVTNDSSITTGDMTTISNVTAMVTEPSTTLNVTTMVTTVKTTMPITNVSLTTLSAVTNDSSVTTGDMTTISNVTAMVTEPSTTPNVPTMVTEPSTTPNVTTMVTTTEKTMPITNMSLTTLPAVTKDSSITNDKMTTISNVTAKVTEPSTNSNVTTMVTEANTTVNVTSSLTTAVSNYTSPTPTESKLTTIITESMTSRSSLAPSTSEPTSTTMIPTTSTPSTEPAIMTSVKSTDPVTTQSATTTNEQSTVKATEANTESVSTSSAMPSTVPQTSGSRTSVTPAGPTETTAQSPILENSNEVFLRFRITGAEFTNALTQPTSPQYMNLEAEVISLMEQVYSSTSDLKSVDVTRFLQGSVIPEVRLEFTSPLDEDSKRDVVGVLYDTVDASGGRLGNFTVDNVASIDANGSFHSVDACFILPCPSGAYCYVDPNDNQCWLTCDRNSGYCLNGGTCVPPGNGETIATCSCASDYEGRRCEVEKSNVAPPPDLQNRLVIVLASVCGIMAVLFFILAIVLICWCRKLRYSKRVIEEDPAQVAKWQDRSRRSRAQRDAESSGDETADGQSGVAGTSYIRHEPDARLQHNLVAIQDDSSGSNFYLTDSDSDSGVFRPKIIEGGVSFPFFDGSGSIPDLLASAADYEMDVMNRMSSNKPLSNSMRGRSVSFSDIQQVISDDDRIGFENFSFGSEAVNPNANNNFHMRWDFQVGGNRSADDADGPNDNNERDKGGGGLSGETNA